MSDSSTTPDPPVGEIPVTQSGPATSRKPSRKDAHHDDPLRGSRTSGAWTAVIIAAVLLVLLVIFIVQNTEKTKIEFLGFDGAMPLAAALLLATVVGMVLSAAIGSLRIIQLRRRVKRERR